MAIGGVGVGKGMVGVVQGQESQNRKGGVGEKLGEGGCGRLGQGEMKVGKEGFGMGNGRGVGQGKHAGGREGHSVGNGILERNVWE